MASASAYPKALFQLGRVCWTAKARAALIVSATDPLPLLKRHMSGDWGILSDGEKQENERALRAGDSVLSAYTLPNTEITITILTEADRSRTTFMLPSDIWGW